MKKNIVSLLAVVLVFGAVYVINLLSDYDDKKTDPTKPQTEVPHSVEVIPSIDSAMQERLDAMEKELKVVKRNLRSARSKKDTVIIIKDSI